MNRRQILRLAGVAAVINAGLMDPGIKARLADLGDMPLALTPAEFGAFTAAETEKWAKVVGAKAE
jgi:hypothetical protein